MSRLLLAWRVLVGSAVVSTAPAPACARCGELERDRDYWRSREERTTEALLMHSAGVAGVARTPPANTKNPAGMALSALSISAIDSTKTLSKPGQGEMSGHPRTT